jgi:hypothetical protein
MGYIVSPIPPRPKGAAKSKNALFALFLMTTTPSTAANPAKEQVVKLYNSQEEATAKEGNFQDIDGSIYDTVEEAESYFPEGGVFAFKEDDGIRVAWTEQHEG